jgi:PAS domain S-box-containing protein
MTLAGRWPRGMLTSAIGLPAEMTNTALTGLSALPEGVPSADEYRRFVESVTDYAMLLLDRSGRIRTWTPGAERLEGYAADEIIGQHISRFYTPEDITAGKPQEHLTIAERESRVESEGWRVRKDGTWFWANVVLTALRGGEGELLGFGEVTRDLTQRRAHEEELRRAEQRFHQLVDAVSEYSIFMLDPTGHVTTWNPGAQKTKGYTAKEIVGRHFSAFYTPQDQALGRPAQILDTVRRVGRFEEEGWRVRKDGTRFWAWVVISILRNEDGEPIGFAKITRDLTERRAAEQQLRDSEERFRLLVAGVTDYAIYMLSPVGQVQTWNLGAERMKGWSADEIIGRSFELFFREEDRVARKPQLELQTASSVGRFEDEGYRVRKDGTSFWANVVLTAIRDEQGRLVGFAKVTRDLTSRREAEAIERELMQAQAARTFAEAIARKSDEANRVKDEFLATVSHELRTPLNAIVGWASILKQRELEPTLARAVEVIDRNAHAQVKIIEDILDVSRIIAGKMRIDPQPADLVAITNQAIDVTRHSAVAKQIHVEFPQSAESCPLVADAERIQQVIWNLLANAIKFTGPGGVVIIRLERQEGSVSLSVIDSGIGLDSELVPALFERFKQEDSSTTRRFGGLGLGLALVRHITELHGGAVSASSPGRGRGSTFTLTLPIRAARSSPPPPAGSPSVGGGSRQSPPAPPPMVVNVLAGLRVLVVEDEPDARELVCATLTSAGAVVRSAASASEGFEVLRVFKPQVLISDIGMPGEDGYSLMRRVRLLDAGVGGRLPSIALTAYTRAEDRTKALAAGFTTHVGKPVDPLDLVAAVSNLAAFAGR